MFKLLEIEFINHPFFESLNVQFIGENEEQAQNYTTLIIGPNGTGKSQILLSIVNIFNSISELIEFPEKKYKFSYNYTIKYLIDDKNHSIDFKKNQLLIDGLHYKDNLTIELLPRRILVNAFNFNDKFPLRIKGKRIVNPNYFYLGLKSATNNIFINNPSKTTIDNLYTAIYNGKNVSNLSEGFRILGLKPEINVLYKKGRNFKLLQLDEFWNNNVLNANTFRRLFKSYLSKKKKDIGTDESFRYANEKIQKTISDDEKISITLKYLNDKIRVFTDTSGPKIGYSPIINFTNEETYKDFIEHIIPFQTLRDLEIISFEGFELNKNRNKYTFDNASSGEYHIISTILNINTYIEDNSLVLLDEPEISLHPNWQMQYMRVLNRTFRNYPYTHFILGSHSHFIISDLNKANSNVVSLSFNSIENQIVATPLNKDTMGWSPEAILYHVFGVVNVRNRYFENDLRTALNIISNKADKKQLKSIYDRLIRFNLPEADPLKIVISDIHDYINETPVS